MFLSLSTWTTGLIYFGILEGVYGATPGKRLFGLKVIDQFGGAPGIVRALIRFSVLFSLPWSIQIFGFWAGVLNDPSHPTYFLFIHQTLVFVSFCVAVITAIHDKLSNTRVVVLQAIVKEASANKAIVASGNQADPSNSGVRIGPYVLCESLGRIGEIEWLRARDERLNRDVWIRRSLTVSSALPLSWTNISRVGRLRWLCGSRKADQIWDAFEFLPGKPLSSLVRTSQPWSRVRVLLFDLASEICAAQKDATMPSHLSLEQVWIGDNGRLKLCDTWLPGAQTEQTDRPFDSATNSSSNASSVGLFLHDAAAALLSGKESQDKAQLNSIAIPLPMKARKLLNRLETTPNIEDIVAQVHLFLRQPTEIGRLRRLAIVLICIAMPLVLVSFLCGVFASFWQYQTPEVASMQKCLMMHYMVRHNLGYAKSTGLQPRTIEIYIVDHFDSILKDDKFWKGTYVPVTIQPDGRQIAQELNGRIIEHSAEESQEAKVLVERQFNYFATIKPSSFIVPYIFIFLWGANVYVAVPGLIAALAFRGGLTLLLTGQTFVCNTGSKASRLRVLGRAAIIWMPWFGITILYHLTVNRYRWSTSLILSLIVVYVLAMIVSLLLPDRGIPDRLAGTYLIPS